MQLWVFHLHYKSTFSESLLKPRLRRAVSTYLSLHTFWKETLISCELHFFRIYLTIPKEEFRVYCEFCEFNPIHFHPGIAEIMKEFQKTRNQLPKYPSCIRNAHLSSNILVLCTIESICIPSKEACCTILYNSQGLLTWLYHPTAKYSL